MARLGKKFTRHNVSWYSTIYRKQFSFAILEQNSFPDIGQFVCCVDSAHAIVFGTWFSSLFGLTAAILLVLILRS